MPEAPHALSPPVRPPRGCLWALLVLLVLMVGGVVTVWLWPQPPTVSAVVRIATGPGPFGLSKPPTEKELAELREYQIALVRNRLVLASVLKDPRVATLPFAAQPQNAIEWLEANVNADFNLSPRLLRISMRGHDTASLTLIVDAVREAYLREVVDKQRLRELEKQKVLTKLITEYEDKLKAARAAQKGLEGLLRDRKHVMLPKLLEAAHDEFREYQLELRKARLAKLTASVRLAVMKAEKGAKALSEEEIRTKAAAEKEILFLDAQIASLTAEINIMIDRVVTLEKSGAKREAPDEDNGVVKKMLEHLKSEKENLDIKLRARSEFEVFEKATVRPAPDRLAELMKFFSPGP